jgi:hypothetical protein
VGTGVARAALASLGWYMIERTGGPLQIPAFALAMMAWPEGVMLDERRLTPVPPAFYVQLSVLLIASTLAVSCLVAVIAAKSRKPYSSPTRCARSANRLSSRSES